MPDAYSQSSTTTPPPMAPYVFWYSPTRSACQSSPIEASIHYSVAVLAGLEPGGVAGIFLAIPAVAALGVAWRHGLGWLDEQPESVRV